MLHIGGSAPVIAPVYKREGLDKVEDQEGSSNLQRALAQTFEICL